jgi:hypothetical protein
MAESIGYMSVADAADGDDPFDFNLTLGYRWVRSSGAVQREFVDLGSSDHLTQMLKVADYLATWQYLDVAAEIGLYHDLSFRFHLPVLLSYDQSIRNIVTSGPIGPEVQSVLGSADAVSPTRSGIPEIIVGVAWAPMNQHRRSDRPTWLWLFNVAIPFGDTMGACLEGEPNCSGPGVTTGAIRLLPEWRLSRRFRHVEAYGAFSGDIAFATKSKDLFRPAGNLSGYQNTAPPVKGFLTMGFALIPWEQRATHQRLAVDFRFLAGYVSQARNFSPLFDALGARAPSTFNPQPVCPGGTVGDCMAVDATAFNGLTDTEAYGTLGGRVTVEVMAARYVTFFLTSGVQWQSAHLITFADECNASVTGGPNDIGCPNDTTANPHYQAAIDAAGRRFGMGNVTHVDIQLRAQGTF